MATYPPWLAGQRVTAGQLTAMETQIAYKVAPTARASTTTLMPDPDLTLPVDASAIYSLEGLLIFNGGAASDDMKMGWTAPSGATMPWIATGQNTSATTGNGPVITDAQDLASTNYSLGTIGNVRGMTAMLRGLLITATAAGSLTLNWAQFASSTTATQMLTGSHFRLQRVG